MSTLEAVVEELKHLSPAELEEAAGYIYRLRVDEENGVLRERDELSSFVNTWTVAAEGAGSKVTREASWDGAGGIGGIFESLFAPIGLRRIYAQVLARLAQVVSRD